MDSRVGHERSLGPGAICTAWAVMLGLGCSAILAGDRLAAPLAPQARQGVGSLFAGNPFTIEVAALLAYAGLILFLPAVMLVGFTLIDATASGGKARYRLREPAWIVQLVFMTICNLVLIGVARFHFRPEPLISIPASSDPLLHVLATAGLFLAAMIVSDVLIYWIHRAQHRFAFLWRFHAVHHSQTVDALHNINHPIETLTSYLLVTIPVGLLVRVSSIDLLVFAAFFSIQGQLNHMRSPLNLGPLGRLLSDNRFHFVHHSRDPAHFNRNFAARFTFVDRMFGTYSPPMEVLPETGLSDQMPPRGLREYLIGLPSPRSVPADILTSQHQPA